MDRPRTRSGRSLAEEALRYLVDEFVFIHGEDRRIVFVSPSVEAVLGYGETQFLRLRTSDLIHPDDLAAATRTSMGLRAKEGASYRGRYRIRHVDGHYLWCEIVGRNLIGTDLDGIVNTVRDIRQQVELEERLQRQALHDELTGLPNRRCLLERLAAVEKRGEPVGLLSIDLDGFKALNDSLGHVAGDELLKRFARTLAGVLRIQDTAARPGGDEFLVLCPGLTDARALRLLAERVRRAGGGTYTLADGTGSVTVSVGAVLGAAGARTEALLRAADNALYAAKRTGRNRVVVAD